MNNALPSLNSIRFFESAARNLSFTRAADELFVTQGAVSKQIKLLEGQLGCALFVRKGPNLTLTKDGEELLATVSSALEGIQLGVTRLRRKRDTSLTLSVLPSFASIWLMPKIMEFEEENPHISVRQTASFSMVDFSVNTDIDAAIRLGKGDWEGLYTRQLTRDYIYPVCDPATAKSIHAIPDLANHTVLIEPFGKVFLSKNPKLAEEQKRYGEWKGWFEAAGEPLCINEHRIIDETGTMIRAALLGKGVALLREELITDYLAAGALVKLFDVQHHSEFHYYFVCPMERKGEEKISKFRHWLDRVSN